MRLTMAAVTLALLMAFPVTIRAAEGRGPSGCPTGIDAKKWVCLTREEAQRIKLEKLDAQDREIDLREEIAKLRAMSPRGIGRFVRPWASVGIGKGLNSDYYGYAYGGVSVGSVSLWAGFASSEPSAGIGWDF